MCNGDQAAGSGHALTADDVEEGEVDALVQGLLKGVTAEGFEDCFKAKVRTHTRPGARNQSCPRAHKRLSSEIAAQGCS